MRFHDVRMRGFQSRSTVEEALGWIDRTMVRGGGETISLEEGAGRVLAEEIRAPANVPAFDRSAMDGFAIRGEESIGASPYHPLVLKVVGESLAGRPTDKVVSAGEAVRIMTGAPMPEGADTIVPAEFATDRGEEVEINAATAVGKNVGRIGEDLKEGAIVLNTGRRLRAQDVGILASLGVGRILVVRRPRVRILVTGNEVVPVGGPRGKHQVYDANSFMLRALVTRDGGVVESCRHVPDDAEGLKEAMLSPGGEVILISGGSSVGREDHAPALIAGHGELAIHGIAMRPSSPAGMGKVGESVVFLLPGNPVSCLCAYDFFAGRGIRQMGGRSGEWPYRKVRLPLTRKISSALGRVDYCRVRREGEGVEPVALSGAAILSSTTRADGFTIVPAASEGSPQGAEVDVYLYD